VFTMDLYRPLLNPNASDRHMVRVGAWSSFVILVLTVGIAIWLSRGQHGVFYLIQDVGAWIAAPISVVFLLGVLWKRATSAAATTVLLFGFPYTALLQFFAFPKISVLKPYDNFLNRTFLVWLTCLIVMALVSLCTKAPPADVVDGIVWNRSFLCLPAAERAMNRGIRSPILWWSVLVLCAFGLYGYVIWFQFFGQKMLSGI
ncbi:MAG: hypothetical protein V4734_02495, partial [Terriglobus sp.]